MNETMITPTKETSEATIQGILLQTLPRVTNTLISVLILVGIKFGRFGGFW